MAWGWVFALMVLSVAAISSVSAEARSLRDIQGASFGEIGYLSPVRCPIGGRYDCLTFPRNLYELNDVCFTLELGSALLGYEEAMFIQFRSGGFALMVKSGYGDRFEIVEIERVYDCPRLY